jgi:hypothetical protein
MPTAYEYVVGKTTPVCHVTRHLLVARCIPTTAKYLFRSVANCGRDRIHGIIIAKG